MRIVQLTTVHRWDDIRIYHKISRSLAAAGHEVHLVVQRPATGPVPDPDGITMHWLPPTGSRPGRLRNAWRAVGEIRRIRPDVVHFHDPELMPVAALLRALGYRVVYDVHEDVPRDIQHKLWIPRLLRYPMSWAASGMEWIFSRFVATAVISVTDHIAGRFPRRRTIVLRNLPILDDVPEPSPSGGPSDNLMVYIGGLSADRGIIELIEATRIVRERGMDMRLELIGRPDSPEFGARIDAAIEGLPVTCLGHVNRERVKERLGAAYVSMVTHHPYPNYLECLPTKLFEAMSAAVPVIASRFPAWLVYVEDEGCGLLVDPEDSVAIADAMVWMLEHRDEAEAMGRRGRLGAEQRYNWEAESSRLTDLYAALEKGDPIAR